MDFAHSERTVELRKLLQDFVDHQVRPGDSEFQSCAAIAEVMGRLPRSSEVFNCSPPDSVNMQILHRFATREQEQTWLEALPDEVHLRQIAERELGRAAEAWQW